MKKLMQKIFNRNMDNNYRKRIFLIMILVAIIPMIGVSIVNIDVISSRILEREYSEVENNLNKIVYNTNNLLTGIESLSNSIYLNSELSDALNTTLSEDIGYAYVKIIYPVLRQAKALNNYIYDISVLIDEQSDFIPNGKEVVRITDEDKNEDFYLKLFAAEKSQNIYWDKTDEIENNNVWIYYRKLDQYAFSNRVVLKIEISEKYIYDNFIGSHENKIYYLCDAKNYVISSNDRESVGNVLPGDILEHKDFDEVQETYIFREIPGAVNPNSYVVVKILEQGMKKEIVKWNFLYLGSTLLIFMFIIAISLRLLRKDVSKIDAVAHSLSMVVDGDYSGKVDFNGNDELTRLGQNYDKMLDYLNYLIKETYEKNIQIAQYETAQKQTELTVLQNQIHPHFLYNTLDAIRMLTILNDNMTVEDSLVALANYFKYNVGFGSDEVKIAEEVEHACNFMDLINIRREVPVEVINEIDEKVMKQRVIRFLLQPLVENAVKHGFARDFNGIIVLKSCFHGDSFSLFIEDNGKNLSEDKLTVINLRLQNGEISESNENVGLLNVNKRIKLKYGEAYGIRVTNNEKGITVTVVIPIKEEVAE